MGDIGKLPNELWLMILDDCIRDVEWPIELDYLVVLGNLSMTCRRLRTLVLPLLDEAIQASVADTTSDRELPPAWDSCRSRVLLELWHALRQCPMLAHRIRTLRPDLTALDDASTAVFPSAAAAAASHRQPRQQQQQQQQQQQRHALPARVAALAPFGQKALRSLGLAESIAEWHTADGWVALLLLVLPKLERIKWAGAGHVPMDSPLRRMVTIAKSQKPPRSFACLERVLVFSYHSNLPDALRWDFLALPSVETIQGPASGPFVGLADQLQVSRDLRRVSIETFQSGGLPLPMHLLEEKFRLMPSVRAFRYRYSLHHNGGFIQMMALTHALRQLHRSLEDVDIEPLAPNSPLHRRRGARTSPHMWRHHPEQPTAIGNLGDAAWLLGSLTAFERLRVVRAPRTALYDPRYVVALKHILPRSLRHLDISPGPRPHKLDAATLTTQLVALVRSKPDRFPRFTKLTLGDHVALLTPLLRDVCAKFDVAIDMCTPATPVPPAVHEHTDAERAAPKAPPDAAAEKGEMQVSVAQVVIETINLTTN